jgi:Protein of unknown function (DUF551)
MGDHNIGYNASVGRGIAYEGRICINGFGFDISCGNQAMRLDICANDTRSIGGMMEWISIKDKLPEDGQMIAACSDRLQIGCVCRYCAFEEEKLPCLKFALNCLAIGWKDMTHWMPLPKPPFS